uniref:Thrombospondin type 1 domain-containing protein n=1 Tax=Globodera pallida TaxID=36090 RepID=A0A183BIX9_GLOPA
MLGWWRLLLMYGIAINLGIDEPVSTALDVNGYKASDEKSSKGVNGPGLNASDVKGSKASDVNGSKASDGNGPNASGGNGLNVSDGNGLNASDGNGLNASDVNGFKASHALDVNASKASDGNGSKASDGNGLNASDVNGFKASHALDVNASKASDGNGSKASDGNGLNVSDENGLKASDVNGSKASHGNGLNASDGNGLNASDGNGLNASDGNGLNASDGNGLNASDGNGLNASDGNGLNASDGNGPNALGGNDSTALAVIGSNAENKISHVNVRQKREPFTLTALAITFVTALVTAAGTSAGQKIVGAIAGNGGVETGPGQVFASSTKSCDEECTKSGYKWTCCEFKQLIKDITSTALDVNASKASDGNGSKASDGNGLNASDGNGLNASDGNGPNALGGNDSTALAVIGSNAENKISHVNVRQKREPFTLTALAITFVTALVTAAGTSAGQKIVGAIAGNGGVETGPGQVFASSTKSCDEECTKCNWGNCVPKEALPGDNCCTAGYKWTCCEFKQLIKDITSTSVVSAGEEKDMTFKIDEDIYEPDSCRHPSASIRGDFFDYDHADPNNVKAIIRPAFMLENVDECPKCGWEVCITKLDSLVCTCCDHSRLGECRWGWTENCLYEPNILSERQFDCPNCAWKMRHSAKKFTCCDHETLKNCSAGLGVPKSAPLMTVQSNEVKKSDACQLLMEEQCKCKWGSCFPRKGRAANKCCTDNYDLVCCEKGSNKAAFFMVTAQLVVGRILTKMVTN